MSSPFDRFVPLSFTGLRNMLGADGDVFCFRAFADAANPSGLRLEGTSERYSAMSLIGLARQAALGRHPDFDTGPIADRLHGWAASAAALGDAGLVLWAEVLREDPRAEDTAAAMLRRRDEPFAKDHDLPSMETGFLLIGLAEAVREGVGGATVATLAADVAGRLTGNQHPITGLFSFGRRLRRKNLHRARMDWRLGSFASQVYPTMGFAALACAIGDATSRDVALLCADRLCQLQGDEGQWWWVYSPHRIPASGPAVRYPVYTVHQDAMGPMALCTAGFAAREDCDPIAGKPGAAKPGAAKPGAGKPSAEQRYGAAIERSLAWFDDRPECATAELIDDRRGAVWRAVQHDDPDTTERLGLSRRELARMGRTAWLSSVDKRPLSGGFVCPECRPYHLGWILLAAAMHEERLKNPS